MLITVTRTVSIWKEGGGVQTVKSTHRQTQAKTSDNRQTDPQIKADRQTKRPQKDRQK